MTSFLLLLWLAQQRERSVAVERTRNRFGLEDQTARPASSRKAAGHLDLRPEQVILALCTDTARIVTDRLLRRMDNGVLHQHEIDSLRHPCTSPRRQASTARSTAAM